MTTEKAWEPVEVPAGEAQVNREPAVALIGEVAHLVWQTDGVLFHAIRNAGAWTEPLEIALGSQPALCVTVGDRLQCLFVNEFIGNYEIYQVTWNGKEWSLPENVSHTSGASTHPAPAAGPDGTLYAVWCDDSPGYPAIYWGRRGPKDQFWSSAPLPNGRGANPVLAVAAGGELWAAWQDQVGEAQARDVLCSRCIGGVWQLPENVSDTPAAESLRPSLVVDGRSAGHLAWQEQQGIAYQVFYSQRLPGGWTAPVELSGMEVDCLAPRLALGPGASVQLAFFAGHKLYCLSRPIAAEAPWPAAWPELENRGEPSQLALGVSGDGALVAAWASFAADGAWRLQYAARPSQMEHSTFLPVVTHGP